MESYGASIFFEKFYPSYLERHCAVTDKIFNLYHPEMKAGVLS